MNFSKRMERMQASEIRELLKLTAQPDIISFAGGLPAPELFPVEEIAKVSHDLVLKEGRQLLQYATTEGRPSLRAKIAKRMADKYHTNVDPDEILITTGSQQCLDFAGKLFLNPGDVVLCESPSYLGALNAFNAYEPTFVEVPTDDGGLLPEELDKILETTPNCKFIYVIPDFQNPTGRTWSMERRQKFMEVVNKHNLPVLEDNPYGELRFAGEDVPTVKSLDTEGIVVYTSSFSKILSSGMRVGYLCGPKQIIDRSVVVKQANDVHTNLFFQMLVSKYLEDNDIDKHIQTIKELYKRKASLMINGLENGLSADVGFTKPEGGLFLWVTLPKTDSSEIFKACIQKNVAVVDGKAFLPQPASCSSVRLNYSMPTDEQITRGTEIFCATVNEFVKR